MTRRKIDLYGSVGVSAIGEVWLIHKAGAQCTLEEREEAQTKICLNFSCLGICIFIASLLREDR